MSRDRNSLEYGYVLTRLPDGSWWHLHVGRSGCHYHCELLGRNTNILACLQRFAAGGLAESPPFLLTLDGEGVELSDLAVGLDFQWPGCLEADAAHFQQEVLPLLHRSVAFQRAAAEVVARQQHLGMVAPGKLIRVD